jgi:hypothetical protein
MFEVLLEQKLSGLLGRIGLILTYLVLRNGMEDLWIKTKAII